MRSTGSPAELEYRRRLAVRRLQEGYPVAEVAVFLEVDPSTVRRWRAAFRRRGQRALAAKPVAGRPLKLSHTQEKIVRRWLADPASAHGFGTELWTGVRLAWLIEEEFGVGFHPSYLSAWLRARLHSANARAGAARTRPASGGPLAGGGLATDQKKARRQGACLVLIDESGLWMVPLLRRTWALRGQRPVLRQQGAHRKKVSLCAALWLSADRQKLGLFCQRLVNGYFDNVRVAAFLDALLAKLQGQRLVVLWDGGPMHKGEPSRALLGRCAGHLTLERLPAYAPMLNPVEPLWSWLKYGRLCNFAPHDARELDHRIKSELRTVQRSQRHLQNLFHASQLPLPRALLT